MIEPSKTRVALRGLAGIGIAFLIGALLAAIVAIAQIRSTQLGGTPLGKQLVASSERILDCTNAGDGDHPAGECYRRNEQRTAAVVANVGRYIVIAAACSAGVDTTLPVEKRIARITACVTKRLAR